VRASAEMRFSMLDGIHARLLAKRAA